MKLYGVFSKGKFALTYKRKVAIDYVGKNGGEVRSINDDPAYHSFDARTFRLISQLEFDQELAVKKNPPSASYRKSGINYLPVIADGKKRETLFGSPLATVATAKKYAQIEINERNRKAPRKYASNPAKDSIDLLAAKHRTKYFYADSDGHVGFKQGGSYHWYKWTANGYTLSGTTKEKGNATRHIVGDQKMQMNPRPRKYVTVIIGQGNYGQGWEDETSYLDDKAGREEARADRKAYRENSQYPFRNIRRKVKIEDYEKGNF